MAPQCMHITASNGAADARKSQVGAKFHQRALMQPSQDRGKLIGTVKEGVAFCGIIQLGGKYCCLDVSNFVKQACPDLQQTSKLHHKRLEDYHICKDV